MERILAVLFLWMTAGLSITDAQSDTALDPKGQAWMQKALDNWEIICGSQLHLPLEPLPWIIFYDEEHAWHVNADTSTLPNQTPAGFALKFNGRSRSVLLVRPSRDHTVWVPDRPPFAVAEAKILTAPYAGGKKSFVICALPALVQRSLGPELIPQFSEFLLGIVGHEMVHTRQVSDVDARFKEIGKRFVLPQSFDDNIVETTFSSDAEYRKLYEPEQAKLLTAALQDDEPETGRKLVQEVLVSMRARRARFFNGNYAAYSELEDVYLMMEGIGQWVHFQIVRRSAPEGQPWQKTAIDFQKQTSSWVQTEGFALFILIDRWVPNWQKKFFSPEFPAPFAVLEHALRREKSSEAHE